MKPLPKGKTWKNCIWQTTILCYLELHINKKICRTKQTTTNPHPPKTTTHLLCLRWLPLPLPPNLLQANVPVPGSSSLLRLLVFLVIQTRDLWELSSLSMVNPCFCTFVPERMINSMELSHVLHHFACSSGALLIASAPFGQAKFWTFASPKEMNLPTPTQHQAAHPRMFFSFSASQAALLVAQPALGFRWLRALGSSALFGRWRSEELAFQKGQLLWRMRKCSSNSEKKDLPNLHHCQRFGIKKVVGQKENPRDHRLQSILMFTIVYPQKDFFWYPFFDPCIAIWKPRCFAELFFLCFPSVWASFPYAPYSWLPSGPAGSRHQRGKEDSSPKTSRKMSKKLSSSMFWPNTYLKSTKFRRKKLLIRTAYTV